MYSYSVGGPNEDIGYGIAFDTDGNQYVTGRCNKNIQFGDSIVTDFYANDYRTFVFNSKDLLLEITNVTVDKDIRIYPNPASEKINIEILFMTKPDIAITIYDLNGKVVEEYHIKNEKNTELSLPVPLTKGVYILQLSDGDLSIRKKLIIK
jgi:hypothetical protein